MPIHEAAFARLRPRCPHDASLDCSCCPLPRPDTIPALGLSRLLDIEMAALLLGFDPSAPLPSGTPFALRHIAVSDAMEARGELIEDVARTCGLSCETVSALVHSADFIESLPITVVQQIANYLGLNPLDLIQPQAVACLGTPDK